MYTSPECRSFERGNKIQSSKLNAATWIFSKRLSIHPSIHPTNTVKPAMGVSWSVVPLPHSLLGPHPYPLNLGEIARTTSYWRIHSSCFRLLQLVLWGRYPKVYCSLLCHLKPRRDVCTIWPTREPDVQQWTATHTSSVRRVHSTARYQTP